MGLKAHRGTFRRQFCDNSPFNAERRYKRGPVCRGRLLFCASLSTLCKSETYSSSCHSASRSPPRLAEIESDGPVNAHPAGVIEELLQKQSVRPLCIFFFLFLLGARKSHRGRGCQNLCMLIIQRSLSKWYDGFPARWILLRVKARRTYFWLCQIFFFFGELPLGEHNANYCFSCSCFSLSFGSNNTPGSYIQDPRSHTHTVLLLQSNTTGKL